MIDLTKIPEDTTRYQKIPEVWVPSDLMATVDEFLHLAKHDSTLPQFKDRQALLEFALDRYLTKHATTPVTLQIPNGIIRFFKEHEKWLRINDAIDSLPEWLSLAIKQNVEATIDSLYKYEETEQLLVEYGFKAN